MKTMNKITLIALIATLFPTFLLYSLGAKKQYKKMYASPVEVITFSEHEKKALQELHNAIKNLENIRVFCTSGTRIPVGAKEIGKFKNPNYSGMPGSGKYCKIYIKEDAQPVAKTATITIQKPSELEPEPEQGETVSVGTEGNWW